MILVSNMSCLYVTRNQRVIAPKQNVIPDDEWKELSEMDDIKEKVDINLFKVLDESTPKVEEKIGDEKRSPLEKSVDIIVSHTEKDAIKLIGNLLDVRVLDALSEKETRIPVLKAVEEQSKEMRKRPKKKDEEGF